MLGWHRQGQDGGFVPARRLSPRHRDVNHDGYPDLVAVFRLSDRELRALLDGQVAQIEVHGIYRDGIFVRTFTALGSVAEDGTPLSQCVDLNDQAGTLVGKRCIWTSAEGSDFKPIDVNGLVEDLNQDLADSGLEIASVSAVVVEAYGGVGEKGANHNTTGCSSTGGSGGPAGYAQVVMSVADLPDGIYIYPGEAGNNDRAGGAGTVVSAVDLAGLSASQLGSTSAQDIVNTGVMALAGGGGGGGNGHVSSGSCHHGGDGGGGGVAIASTSGIVAATGGDGTKGDPGSGGSCAGGGEGGGNHGQAGSDGIGGPGGRSNDSQGKGVGGGPYWNGWSTADSAIYSNTAWTYGAGGYNGNPGGRGGGGCGGGGSANGSGDGHRGGGGGGGSVAIPPTIDPSLISGDLIKGQTAGKSEIVLTFQVLPSSSE